VAVFAGLKYVNLCAVFPFLSSNKICGKAFAVLSKKIIGVCFRRHTHFLTASVIQRGSFLKSFL